MQWLVYKVFHLIDALQAIEGTFSASSGNRASRPYIRRKGVYLVEFWMLVLVANRAKISIPVICLIFHELRHRFKLI